MKRCDRCGRVFALHEADSVVEKTGVVCPDGYEEEWSYPVCPSCGCEYFEDVYPCPTCVGGWTGLGEEYCKDCMTEVREKIVAFRDAVANDFGVSYVDAIAMIEEAESGLE